MHLLKQQTLIALSITLSLLQPIKPTDTYNSAVSWAHAKGAFQHLHKYWNLRRSLAGFEGFDIFDLEANTGVASWLFYTSGPQHWNPSKHCWAKKLVTQ